MSALTIFGLGYVAGAVTAIGFILLDRFIDARDLVLAEGTVK